MAIKAVIFDCFGVLTTDGWKQIRTDLLSTDAERQEADDLDRMVNSGLMGYDEFVARVAKLINQPITETRARLVDTAANERLFAYIRDAIKPHYKLGLLSNAADNWLDNLFAPWQVALFDEVVLSCEVGMVKPDPRIYDVMAMKLGMLPEECLFIDDIERFVTAAIDVGMQARVFTDTNTFIKEFEEKTYEH